MGEGKLFWGVRIELFLSSFWQPAPPCSKHFPWQPSALTHCWWGLQLLWLSGSAWSCSIVCSWKAAFRLWPWFCAVPTEWGLYDRTSQGRRWTIWANNGEITLIAYSIEVVNQNQQLCHHHFPWIQNFRKNEFPDHRVKNIDLGESMGNLVLN